MIQKSIFALAITLFALAARAEVILNPDSRHAQYQTYGLFFEPQSMLVSKSGGNAWAAVGGYIPLVEMTGLPFSPQLVLHASANCSYRMVDDIATFSFMPKFETVDARVGLSYDMKWREDLRAAIIWTHYSGHISDNIADPTLIGPDVGDEAFNFRVIRDYQKTFRVGAGFRPILRSHPSMEVLAFEQFAEWFPQQTPVDSHHLKPFVAAGLEQYGNDSLELTGHLQAGYTTADHFSEKDSSKAMRFVVGAYSGQDPRLKYLQYRHTKQQFLYGGIVIDL
jgi:hypothetical protein